MELLRRHELIAEGVQEYVYVEVEGDDESCERKGKSTRTYT